MNIGGAVVIQKFTTVPFVLIERSLN
jgi:hypothetical protein